MVFLSIYHEPVNINWCVFKRLSSFQIYGSDPSIINHPGFY